MFYFTSEKCREVACFKNRYMNYIIENGTVKAAAFDFI